MKACQFSQSIPYFNHIEDCEQQYQKKGTMKKLKYFFLSFLINQFIRRSVADPGCLFWIRIFPSRIQGQKNSGSGSGNVSIFNPKIVSKLSEMWSGIFILDSESRILISIPIPDSGVKKAPVPGSGSTTLHTILSYKLSLGLYLCSEEGGEPAEELDILVTGGIDDMVKVWTYKWVPSPLHFP